MSDEREDDNLPNNSAPLSPERQIKRARTEASSPIQINTQAGESNNRPLPGFVAG